MNDTTTQSGDHLRTLTPLEVRYKAALEEIRRWPAMPPSDPSWELVYRQQWATDIVDKALAESTFAP